MKEAPHHTRSPNRLYYRCAHSHALPADCSACVHLLHLKCSSAPQRPETDSPKHNTKLYTLFILHSPQPRLLPSLPTRHPDARADQSQIPLTSSDSWTVVGATQALRCVAVINTPRLTNSHGARSEFSSGSFPIFGEQQHSREGQERRDFPRRETSQ